MAVEEAASVLDDQGEVQGASDEASIVQDGSYGRFSHRLNVRKVLHELINNGVTSKHEYVIHFRDPSAMHLMLFYLEDCLVMWQRE